MVCCGPVPGQWHAQPSGADASLRGISAVDPTVAWASGTNGTVLRTTDAGATWQKRSVAGAGSLDFRGIHAFDANTAFVMSAGSGKLSRIYATADGGMRWMLSLENSDPAGFFDAIAFWDRRRGLVMGDPVDGRIFIAMTADGGRTWKRVEAASMPAARTGEGAFAASGTCLITGPNGSAWIATGGTGGGRVYRSADWGQTWQAADTPVRHENESSGIFSLAFQNDKSGIATGGNYSKPEEDRDNTAITHDGGITWKVAESRPKGYRSAVAFVPGTQRVVATGTTGTDISEDGGKSWTHAGDQPFNAMSFAATGAGWAVGPKGAIARYQPAR